MDWDTDRDAIFTALDRSGWPVKESDIMVLEDEIAQARKYLEQSLQLRSAEQEAEEAEQEPASELEPVKEPADPVREEAAASDEAAKEAAGDDDAASQTSSRQYEVSGTLFDEY